MCETHLVGEEVISINNFTWFGFNRKHILRSAKKGSGGVGVLVKSRLLDSYSVSILESEFEGILWVQFLSLSNTENFCLCVCYLPPSNSTRGNTGDEFFNHLKCSVCSLQDIDTYFICGDFNARCSNLEDTSSPIPNIPKRSVTDSAPANSHGKEMIDFLRTYSICMLNGRTMESTKFTSISTKGSAVVDYCLVPIDTYSKFVNFEVVDIVSLADDLKINVAAKTPDHSLLQWDLCLDFSAPPVTSSKFSIFRKMPDGYFQSTETTQKMNLISEQLSVAKSKQDINNAYVGFCEVVNSELVTKQYRPNNRKHKVWWTAELSNLRKITRKSRSTWLVRKKDSALKSAYLEAQKRFDKEVSKAKASYYRKMQENVVNSMCSNPKMFWNKMKELGTGQKPNKTLPNHVLDSNKELVTDSSEVLQTWKNYFSSLLNNDVDVAQPNLSLASTLLEDSVFLSEPFSLEEIICAIKKINSKSAPGPDELKVCYFDNQTCSQFLYELFNKCLELGFVPTAWMCSFIKPIPKTGGNLLDPSDYRGISLQSVVTKVLCSAMNTRLCEYLEHHNLLAEEQNGFRKGRSCQDHLFSLYSIVQNRKLMGQDTHTVFIDFRKAFDSINRDLLWKKLEFQFGLSGKFLRLIRALYEEVVCSVKINDHNTEWFSIESGVKQGCILSPILFSMFINDLALEI